MPRLFDGELHCTIVELAEDDPHNGLTDVLVVGFVERVIVRCTNPLLSLMEVSEQGKKQVSSRLESIREHQCAS